MKKLLIKSAQILLMALVILPASASALSQDQINIFNSGIYYYDVNSSSSSGPVNVCLGGGTLPQIVPEPYNSIFTAAANKHSVPPAFLAALFYAGEHGSSWPSPPAPYGTGSEWADSHVTGSNQDWPPGTPGTRPIGARGPFQFEYPAWTQHGEDGNGDGTTDVEDLTDASFASANYLAALGANTTDTTKLHDAARSYNGSGQQAEDYANKVMAAYQQFSNGSSASPSSPTTPTCSSGSSAGLTNPFPNGWIPNRLDMGYDGTFTGSIVAPFAGTVTYAASSFSNWGGYIELKADQQPNGLPTSTLYFAEGVAPATQSGQHVNAGDPIATPAVSPYGNAYGTTPGGIGQIEWGVAVDGSVGSPTDPLAESGNSGMTNCSQASTDMVMAFAKWVEQNLGVAGPSTTDHAGCA